MFAKIPKTTSKTFIIMNLFLLFISVEWSQAATEDKISKPSPALEMEFSGTGSMTTRTFMVEDGWKIRWETESPTFKLSAHGSAKRPYVGQTNERDESLRWFETRQPIVLANTTDQHGTAVHPLGGTFYFTIVAGGPWRIDLKTFKDTKDYLDVPYTGGP